MKCAHLADCTTIEEFQTDSDEICCLSLSIGPLFSQHRSKRCTTTEKPQLAVAD